MLLGTIIHRTADKAYEDLRKLQADCITASDADRKRLIIDYCETQRHRALQLLALRYYAKNDADLVRRALENIGKKATDRRGTFWHAFQITDLAVTKFETTRMPKFDVESAVSVLVNQEFGGVPLIVDSELRKLDEDEWDKEELAASGNAVDRMVASKRPRTMKDRVLSRLLSEEIDLADESTRSIRVTEEGELDIDCLRSGGYAAKLALESVYDETKRTFTSVWYPTSLRIGVKLGDKVIGSSDITYNFIPQKHIPLIAKQLEAYLREEERAGSASSSSTSILHSVHTFLRTLCSALVFQMLEAESKAYNIDCERTSERCKIALNIKDWFLVVERNETMDAREDLLKFRLLHDGKGDHAVQTALDGSELADLSVRRLISAAIRDAARHQLELLRESILVKSSRHHASQARVRLLSREETKNEFEEYYLELDLFHENALLRIKMGSTNALELNTTSKAERWGYHSAREAMDMAVKSLEKNPPSAWGAMLASMWDRAEAWDCLASVSIPGLSSSGRRVAYLPPDVEIAKRHTSKTPSMYWDLGFFEGVRYFFAVQYSPSPSAFHSSFLSLNKRVVEATKCEVVSMEMTSGKHDAGDELKSQEEYSTTAAGVKQAPQYRSETIPLSALGGIADLHRVVRKMRLEWASSKFERFNLHYSEDVWVGGNSEDVQAFSPYGMVFHDEADEAAASCAVLCKNDRGDSFECKRGEPLESAFAEAIRKRGIMRRLLSCSTDNVVVTLGPDWNHCIVTWRDRKDAAVLIGFRTGRTLDVLCPKPHPMQQSIQEELNRDNSVESLKLMISLFEDSDALIAAAGDYAMRKDLKLRVTSSAISNLHFLMYREAPQSGDPVWFDCRLLGHSKTTVWNRSGWGHTSRMMNPEPVTQVSQVINALRE